MCAGRARNDHESLRHRFDRRVARRPRRRYDFAFLVCRPDSLTYGQGAAAGLSNGYDWGLILVRRRHFEALQPVCPVCRTLEKPGSRLQLAHVESEADGHILEGALHCSNPACLREFPIIDGIPLIVSQIRNYVAENALALCSRSDLSSFTESILGDCCGPGSAYDAARQHLSSYAWDHYADWDSAEPWGDPAPGSMVRTLEIGLALAGEASPGPVLDLGCSVGRGSFELAARTGRMVLGIDLHYSMLRLASTVLRERRVRYSLRRVGLVYDRREFPAKVASDENVDFWACDATALPFAPGLFGMTTAMNIIDCVHSPHSLLASVEQMLAPGGAAILASPYDWAPGATPVEAWFGGHSQRSPLRGDSKAMVRSLLTPGARPDSLEHLEIINERDDLPWHVRLHNRSTMTYRTHLLAARKIAAK